MMELSDLLCLYEDETFMAACKEGVQAQLVASAKQLLCIILVRS